MEGHYIRGYGDRTQGAEIYLLKGAVEDAEKHLTRHPDAIEDLDKVTRLIYGFETPYDLELLSTVGWILKEEPELKERPDSIVDSVMTWNERKRQIFPKDHIERVSDYLIKEVEFV